MSSSALFKRTPARLQEGGLLLVIIALGGLLAFFGGSVQKPVFQTMPDGTRERQMHSNAQGEEEPVFVTRNKFFNADSLAGLAKDTSFIAIMAVGATFVIICGGIDLSIGSIYALSSILGALVLRRFGPDAPPSDVPQWLGILLGIGACVGVGALCGLLNGSMIVALKVHPFIITLGTMAIFRQVGFVLTDGQSVGGFPDGFRHLIRGENWDWSLVPLLLMMAVAGMAAVYLSRMAMGRRLYAVGGNELASRYGGIQVGRVKLGVYLVSGLTAGIAATISLGYYGGATPADGQGYELNVIAAAVVGGASLAGGRGTAWGALLGALVIQMIATGIVILGIPQNYSQIITGVVVILAVVLDQCNQWLAKRRLLLRA